MSTVVVSSNDYIEIADPNNWDGNPGFQGGWFNEQQSRRDFRTVTTYETGSNGEFIPGSQQTRVYYKVGSGTWNGADSTGNVDLDNSGYVLAATSTDGGNTFTRNTYTSDDQETLGNYTWSNKISNNGLGVGSDVLNDYTFNQLTTSNTLLSNSVQQQIGEDIQAEIDEGTLSLSQNDRNQLHHQYGHQASDDGTGRTNIQANQEAAIAEGIRNGTLSTVDINLGGVGADNRRRAYPSFAYPKELRNNGELNQQDRIIFKMMEMTGSRINPNIGQRTISRNNPRRIAGQVALPIQNGILDQNQVGWNEGNLNAVEAVGVGAAIGLMNTHDLTELGGTALGLAQRGAAELGRTNSAYAEALKIYLAQEAVGVQNLLSRTTGAVVNPNLELLFSAPQLRPFNFSFNMSPRDEDEARQVRGIIRFFKQGMAVKQSRSSVFLKAPNVFRVKYMTYYEDGTAREHPSINRIKDPCALLNCSVNYTPENSYMTFDDDERTMMTYTITLSFKEIDPIYESDYEGLSDNVIGF